MAEKAEGAIVAEPQADSPALKAGIAAGDVITAMNGAAIKDSRDLARKVGTMAPGTSVKLTVARKGEVKSIDLTLGKMPNQQQAKADTGTSTEGSPRLGLSLAPAKEVAGSGDHGVAVVGVDPNGPADERGIKTGDVILDVGGNGVANVPTCARHSAKRAPRQDCGADPRENRRSGEVRCLPVGKA